MEKINRILNPKKALLEDVIEASKIVNNILLELKTMTEPDVSLEMLAEFAEKSIISAGAIPTFKGYKPEGVEKPFPYAICTSIDGEIAHGMPHSRSLREGNIVKYDIGLKYKSGCADAAITVAVGEIDNRKKRAMRYGLNALYEGIKQVKAGTPISAIGKAIEDYCATNGYYVIKEMAGHHIGESMHEEPYILNYYSKDYDNIFLKEGSVICIEPMITPEEPKVKTWEYDKWTVFTSNFQPVTHFESMVLVKEDGYEVLNDWKKLLK